MLEVLAKLAAAAGLYAYLLHRGGVRPAAATAVTLAHLVAMSCACPVSAELGFATTVSFGTCSYAVLVVDRPWIRAGVVAACLLAFGALLARASGALVIVAIAPLALWIGFMVLLRDWARSRPESRRPTAISAEDEP